jgi:hypothetical protein
MRLLALLSLLPLTLAALPDEGPCEISDDTCWDVMNASTCFAAFGMGRDARTPKNIVMRCINSEDYGKAQEVVSTPQAIEEKLRGWGRMWADVWVLGV